jgi:hypothetical protein
MRCPYTDIGCWHIDDVTHDCEAETMSQCHHASHEPVQSRKSERKEDDEE